jgi:CDC45-like protein
LLDHGIALAIHFQQLLVSQCMSLLEKKGVKTLKKFQFVVLPDSLFASVTMLHALLGFLMDAYKEYGNNKKRVPFVIAAPLNDDYVVMGRQAVSSSLGKK